MSNHPLGMETAVHTPYPSPYARYDWECGCALAADLRTGEPILTRACNEHKPALYQHQDEAYAQFQAELKCSNEAAPEEDDDE